MESNGKQFIPYGFVVACAAYPDMTDISRLCTGDDISHNTGNAVIKAAAVTWHANIVRLQVAQEDLFSGAGGSVNQAYVNLVDGLVSEANSLGMVAIVTLQEELAGGYAFPTASSTAFWQYMAGHYKNNPDVFFDLYNEPQLGTNAAGSTANVWNIWQNGGEALVQTDSSGLGTTDITYVGMQSLVNTIRAQGANNIIIAESNDKDQNLSELPSHLLSGSNIAYGIEPNLHGDNTQAEQYTRFGQYASKWLIMPEAFLDIYGDESCDPTSASDIPGLFSYLKSLDMGLVSWSLDPGIDIVGTNLAVPTSYSASAMQSFNSANCPNTGSGSGTSQNNPIGAGQLIQQYYQVNSVLAGM
jgi:hypothetical protein